MPNTDKIKGDLWQAYIGGTLSPFLVSVSIKGVISLSPVMSALTGKTPVAHIVDGHPCVLGLIWQEWDPAEIKRALGITGAGTDDVFNLPAIGTKMPNHTLRLHDPNASDNTTDLYFPQVVFTGLDRTMDGQGNAQYTNEAYIEADASGVAVQLGYTAP